MRVDGDTLRALDACLEQVAIFEEEWPDGVEVDRAALARAAEMGLDTGWWLVKAFPARDAEYEAALKQLYAEYWAALKPLAAEYRAALKPLDDEYWAKRKPLDAEYEAARKQLDAEDWRSVSALVADLLGLPGCEEAL